MRFLRHSVSFLVCLYVCAAALAQAAVPPSAPTDPATVSLITGRDPIVTMRGKWRFQPGDDPHYADPAFDDSHWVLLKSNESWFNQGYKDLSGYAWYRFRVVLPAGTDPYELELPPINTGYQAFLDGKLIRTVGPMQGRWLFNRTFIVIPLPSAPRTAPETITVALRIWHSPVWARYYGGGPLSEGGVGTKKEIESDMRLIRLQVQSNLTAPLVLGLLAFLAGTASIGLFFLRRSAREYLWFAILCLAYLIPDLITYFVALKVVNGGLIETAIEVFGAAFSISLILLLRQIFEQKLTWLYRIAIAAVLLGFIPFAADEWFRILSVGASNGIQTALASIFSICLLIIIFRKTWQKAPDAAFLLASFFLFEFVHLTQSFLWTAQTFGHPLRMSLSQFIDNPFPITMGNVADFALFAGILVVLLNRFARSSREQDRIAADLESARTLQQVLIPETLPTIPGIAIATAYHPAQEVGGDFFQIIPIPSGDTLIVLGDVSGKGLPAAMTVSLIVGALRTIVEFTSSPAEILAALNRRLHGRGSGFTTCVALRISPSGLLTIANAGHLAPYLNGEELETDATLPLGLDPDLTLGERTRQTAPSDHLTLITDGVLEATDPEGKLFGFDRTLTSSTQSAAHIASLARDFGQSDDITVLTLDFA